MVFVYLALGTTLLLCCGSRLQQRHPRLLFGLVLATLVVPLILDHSAHNVVQIAAVLVLLGVEALFRHADYAAVSDENLKSAAFVSFKRLASVFVTLFVVPQILSWGTPAWSMSAHGVPAVVQGIVGFLVLDFYLWAYHWTQHRVGFMWHFHKLHHGTAELTVFASGRSHVVDATLKLTGVMLVSYVLGLSPEVFTYGFALPILLLDSFNHSNIDFPRTRWRWLAQVFTSPNAHAVHHTPDRDRMNYGVALMIWDRIFGTFELPATRPTVFGLEDRAWGRAGVMWQHLEPLRVMLPSPPRVTAYKP